jgi:hypothetical protein
MEMSEVNEHISLGFVPTSIVQATTWQEGRISAELLSNQGVEK